MENIYEILDERGSSLGNIVATEDYVNIKYPGRYRYIGPENAVPPVIKPAALKGRLTNEEEAAIEAAKDTNQYARGFLSVINGAPDKNGVVVVPTQVSLLPIPPWTAMINGMVSTGLLTQERADMVFSQTVTFEESPFY
jgi:hypothetical protein